jgi:RNA polymerase sigma-70 factor (ECF subfamily)
MNLKLLILKCLEGNREAWEMLIRKYSSKIFNLTFQFCGIYQEAEDLTQEIFIKLFKRLSRYSFQKSFDAWLFALARNHCIDYYRKHKHEKQFREKLNESKVTYDYDINQN